MPSRSMDSSKAPRTFKGALKQNVQHQKRRAAYTESPPEAQRSPRERVKSMEKKRKH